jgi:hypothetical protein
MPARYLNIVMGRLIVAAPWLLSGHSAATLWHDVLVELVLPALSIRRGRIEGTFRHVESVPRLTVGTHALRGVAMHAHRARPHASVLRPPERHASQPDTLPASDPRPGQEPTKPLPGPGPTNPIPGPGPTNPFPGPGPTIPPSPPHRAPHTAVRLSLRRGCGDRRIQREVVTLDHGGTWPTSAL